MQKEKKYWSEKLDCYVSRSFHNKESKQANIKIDITKCDLVINEFGFYYLYLEGRSIKKLSFNEFQKYKRVVSSVINKKTVRYN